MRVVEIDETGKKRSPFTHKDQPAPAVVGKCAKCGGGLRAEEFDSWTKEQGLVRKRVYRCIQRAHHCPAVMVTIGQDGQEEVAMAKRVGMTFAQTREWCEKTKEALKAKHLAYKDVAKAAAISQSALAQGLNMHLSLCADTQARIEAAIAGSDPAQAEKVRKERASRKPKVEPSPGSVGGAQPLLPFQLGPLQFQVGDHENRIFKLEEARQEMLHEQEQVDADNARRFQEIEDRITESHNHLSEQMAGLPLVAAPIEPDTTFHWNYLGTVLPATRIHPEDLLGALVRLTPDQVTALVTAATAKRDFLKALEAA